MVHPLHIMSDASSSGFALTGFALHFTQHNQYQWESQCYDQLSGNELQAIIFHLHFINDLLVIA